MKVEVEVEVKGKWSEMMGEGREEDENQVSSIPARDASVEDGDR